MLSLQEKKYKANEDNVRVKNPLLGVVVSLALGIIAGEYFHFQLSVLFILICFLLIFVMVAIKESFISSLMVLITVFCLGGFLCQARDVLQRDHVYHVAKYYREGSAEIKGLIISDVSRKKSFQTTKTTFAMDVKEIKSPWGWRKRTGMILVDIFGDADMRYGDIVRISGKMHKPYDFSGKGKFSYREYLNRRSLKLILSVKKNAPIEILKRDQGSGFKAKVFRMRAYFKKKFTDNLTENESGLMCAMLLGDRAHIPIHIRELFVKTGTAHILAISGLHVS
ncbi:MAG: ComEC/Rec2 family competence protein, partial [Candidatus Omnitrophica bacterium]|nr:ComEC/Rec2 family competence protein [Candidatus Omnitrophota bacterium]